MSKEQPQPTAPFVFTEREQLWNRISDDRLRALLDDRQVTIHKAAVDTNNYGEFLFITVSRPAEARSQVLILFGYGYHEHRERWYTDQWVWFQANPFPQTLEQHLTREEAEASLQVRQEAIAPYAAHAVQTERGKLFEMIADMTDDDGAIAEMEDLGDLWDDLADGLE